MAFRPDYENYTFRELLEAQQAVNREKYPERAKEIDILVENIISNPEYQEKQKRRIENQKYLTFWPRFFALFIDGIFLSLIFTFIVFIGSFFGDIRYLFDYEDYAEIIYVIIMHALYGQTIGKMLTSVKVVDFETENDITFKQAFLRDSVAVFFIIILLILLLFVPQNTKEAPIWLLSIISILSFFYLFWSILEIITMLFSEKRRALHDLIAGTVVIRINHKENPVS